MKPLILGIDPGLKGSLALYDHVHRRLACSPIDMPTLVHRASGKRIIDVGSLAMWVDTQTSLIEFAVLEDVHSRPGEGVSSVFKFGDGFGAVKGVLAANYIQCHLIKPSVWKILMGLSRDKSLSLDRARALFPGHKDSFRRQKDDGRAEAALLAWFGADRLLYKGTEMNSTTKFIRVQVQIDIPLANMNLDPGQTPENYVRTQFEGMTASEFIEIGQDAKLVNIRHLGGRCDCLPMMRQAGDHVCPTS